MVYQKLSSGFLILEESPLRNYYKNLIEPLIWFSLTEKINQQDYEETRPDDSLAFSRIKEEIQKIADEQADKIINEGNNQAKEILNAATAKAQQENSNILNQATTAAENIRIQEVSRKKLAIKMDFLKYRDEIFQEIQIEAKSKIQKYTKTAKYKEFLVKLVENSSLSIGGGKLSLVVRKEDQSMFPKAELSKIAEKVSKQTGNKTEIQISKDELVSLGGLKLVRSDQKLFVDNSFEVRLERNTDTIRTRLLKLLS